MICCWQHIRLCLALFGARACVTLADLLAFCDPLWTEAGELLLMLCAITPHFLASMLNFASSQPHSLGLSWTLAQPMAHLLTTDQL